MFCLPSVTEVLNCVIFLDFHLSKWDISPFGNKLLINLSLFGRNMIFDPIFLRNLDIFKSWKPFFRIPCAGIYRNQCLTQF